MNPKTNDARKDQELRYLRRLTFFLCVIFVLLAGAFYRMPSTMKVYTAPDTTKGFVQKVNETPDYAVFGFARMLWESINYCEENCGKDYKENLENYETYFTKQCYTQLTDHFNKNKGLFEYRDRRLIATENTLFSPKNIKRVSDSLWLVNLEFVLEEHVRGTKVRDNLMYYPIKIVKAKASIDNNLVGLKADCYFSNGPKLLEQLDVKE